MMRRVLLASLHANGESLDARRVLQILHRTRRVFLDRGRLGARQSLGSPNVADHLFPLALDGIDARGERTVIHKHWRWQAEDLRDVRSQSFRHPLETQVIRMAAVNKAVQTVGTQ